MLKHAMGERVRCSDCWRHAFTDISCSNDYKRFVIRFGRRGLIVLVCSEALDYYRKSPAWGPEVLVW